MVVTHDAQLASWADRVANLLILVIGIPLAAAAIGWLLAGRDPDGLSRQPG